MKLGDLALPDDRWPYRDGNRHRRGASDKRDRQKCDQRNRMNSHGVTPAYVTEFSKCLDRDYRPKRSRLGPMLPVIAGDSGSPVCDRTINGTGPTDCIWASRVI